MEERRRRFHQTLLGSRLFSIGNADDYADDNQRGGLKTEDRREPEAGG